MRAKVEGAGDMGHSRLQYTAAVDPSRSGLKAQPGAASAGRPFSLPGAVTASSLTLRRSVP